MKYADIRVKQNAIGWYSRKKKLNTLIFA